MITALTPTFLAAQMPGAHRFVVEHVHVMNTLPTVLLIVFAFFAFFAVVVAITNDAPGALVVACLFGLLAWLIPFVALTPRHTDIRHRAQIYMVGAPGQHIWMPAQRLPDGIWWPDGAVRPGK